MPPKKKTKATKSNAAPKVIAKKSVSGKGATKKAAPAKAELPKPPRAASLTDLARQAALARLSR